MSNAPTYKTVLLAALLGVLVNTGRGNAQGNGSVGLLESQPVETRKDLYRDSNISTLVSNELKKIQNILLHDNLSDKDYVKKTLGIDFSEFDYPADDGSVKGINYEGKDSSTVVNYTVNENDKTLEDFSPFKYGFIFRSRVMIEMAKKAICLPLNTFDNWFNQKKACNHSDPGSQFCDFGPYKIKSGNLIALSFGANIESGCINSVVLMEAYPPNTGEASSGR